MNVTAARQYFESVRERPGMYFSPRDWKFVTAVAYIEGWISGTDPEVGERFSSWLGEPSLAWWTSIVMRRLPEWQASLSDLDSELDALLMDDLFEALDGYLAWLEA